MARRTPFPHTPCPWRTRILPKTTSLLVCCCLRFPAVILMLSYQYRSPVLKAMALLLL